MIPSFHVSCLRDVGIVSFTTQRFHEANVVCLFVCLKNLLIYLSESERAREKAQAGVGQAEGGADSLN